MTHAATGAHTATIETAAAAAAAAVTFEHYPLYCYHLSPTITQWCPLRARDIHELAQRRGFEGQDDTFFHLNHPIRWVRVVGVVVAVDQYYGRRVYTVDDGSGACIECVTTVPTVTTTTTSITKKPEEEATAAAAPPKPEDPYADVDVGLVVEARGGLALYRQQKQIRVTRLRRLASTAAEVAFWHKIRAFAADVLARPWVVDARQRRRLEKEARRDVVGGGGGPRRRHRGHDDDEEARAARKRRRHHDHHREEVEERKKKKEAAAAASGDDGAGVRREPETRQRRKERHARDEETPDGIPSRSGNSLDEARQRRKERHARDETASSHGHPPRSGNSLLDEARRRRREKAEKLKEASKSEPSGGKYNALGL